MGLPENTDSSDELKKTSLRVLLLVFLNSTMWLAGGLLFMYLEAPNEAVHKCGVRRVRRDFLDELWTEAQGLDEGDWKSLARKKLEHFEEEIHTAVEAGLNSHTRHNVWTPSNAIQYTFTLASTIGYGGLTPVSPWIRLLSLAYAGVACPLFACLLSQVSALITILTQQVLFGQASSEPYKLKHAAILLGLHSGFGACILAFLFQWTLEDAIYFIGVTFTTVGFGDIVPEDSLIFLMLSAHIVIGLSLYSIYQDIVMSKLSDWLEGWLLKRSTHKIHKE